MLMGTTLNLEKLLQYKLLQYTLKVPTRCRYLTYHTVVVGGGPPLRLNIYFMPPPFFQPPPPAIISDWSLRDLSLIMGWGHDCRNCGCLISWPPTWWHCNFVTSPPPLHKHTKISWPTPQVPIKMPQSRCVSINILVTYLKTCH